ncbi:hypothetical protein D9M68_904830 [compost metagenome]
MGPRSVSSHTHDAPSAGTRSGMIWRRQPKTTSGSIWPMTWRVDTGAGAGALSTQPSGAETENTDSDPELFGMSPATAQARPNMVYAAA